MSDDEDDEDDEESESTKLTNQMGGCWVLGAGCRVHGGVIQSGPAELRKQRRRDLTVHD